MSVLADYFIIADGSNPSQVQAMADNVEEVLEKAGCEKKQIEGYQNANWILMDYGDIVISTTHQLIRFYQAFDLLIIWSESGETAEPLLM